MPISYNKIHINKHLYTFKFLFRPVKCGYSKIGCPWRGPSHEASEHEKVCPHPSATGKDVMSALDAMDQKFQEEKLLYDTIFDLMSFEKITFNGKSIYIIIYYRIVVFDFYSTFLVTYVSLLAINHKQKKTKMAQCLNVLL